MQYVSTKVNMDLDLNPFSGWQDKSTEERLDVFRPMFEFNTGVALGIIFPFTPISSMIRGKDTATIAGQTTASAISTWLIAQSYGATIPLGGVAATRGPVFGAVARAAAPAAIVLPLVSAGVATDVFVDFHTKHQPTEPTHRSSWWNSLAAAMGGTFGGMQYE